MRVLSGSALSSVTAIINSDGSDICFLNVQISEQPKITAEIQEVLAFDTRNQSYGKDFEQQKDLQSKPLQRW